MNSDVGMRDFRLLLRGRFKTQRPFSWQLGYMYDGAEKEWRFRMTGFMIGFPKAHGQLFIGRTKEGYSMVKVMNGYTGWTSERSPTLDAFVPILADGVKWMGYYPGPRIFFSIGAFGDWLSEHEKFSTYDHQIVGRVGWLPILDGKNGDVLHIAVRPRGQAGRGVTAPLAGVPVSPFPRHREDPCRSRTTGAEAYYRSGPWLVGGNQLASTDAERRLRGFTGQRRVLAAWFLNDATRP